MKNAAGNPPVDPKRKLVVFLFFFSGIAGLIYQIVWTRMLILIFGNTMLATSTVLSAYMAGLAAGSFLLGRFVDRRPRKLLKVYAQLEAGIGLYALAFPFLLALFSPLYVDLYRLLAGDIVLLNLVRFLVCFLLIFIPTFLMGGTLPVLSKRYVTAATHIGGETGVLYGLNTAGAMLGSLACGFFFLRAIGMLRSAHVGVLLNLGVALLAWLAGRADRPQESAAEAAVAPAEGPPPITSLATKAVLLGAGISGFCALAYEVFWARMLNLFFHNTVHSFTTMLTTFLFGIAAGSLIYSRYFSRRAKPVRLFGQIEVAIGLLAYTTPYIFSWLFEPLFLKSAAVLTVVKAAVIMVPPTLLMGMALPLAVQICQRGPRREGESVGRVYAVNTVGSILGSFAAGFVLIPLVGIHLSVALVAGLNVLAGFLALFAGARRRRWALIPAGVAILAALFLATPRHLFRGLYQKSQPDAGILYYQEGRIANVVVYDFYKEGYKDLYLNGIEEASSRLWHVQLFKMLGILPAMLHPDPGDSLMIAFGAGMSAGAAAGVVDSLECAELNPDIHGEGEIFRRENLDVLHNPRLKMIFNDGRNHVLLSPKRYSLIISDATNPIAFDSWTLYTREFYELCKSKLEPGGIFCQWIPVPLPGDSLKVILHTFRSVYPHASFWCIYGSSQCLMLGTPERLNIDWERLRARLEPVLKSSGLADFGVDTAQKFLSFFQLGEDELGRYLAGVDRLNTDDLPYAQFHNRINQEGIRSSTGMLLHQRSVMPYLVNTGADAARLQREMQDFLVLSRRMNLGYLLDNAGEYDKAAVFAAARGRPGDANIEWMQKSHAFLRDYFHERAARFPGDANAQNALGYFYWRKGDNARAIVAFRSAIACNADFANARVNLGRACLAAGKFDEAAEAFLQARQMNPTLGMLGMTGKELSIVHLRRKLQFQQKDPDLNMSLGMACLETGEWADALAAFLRAREEQPQDKEPLLALASLYERLDLNDLALEAYRSLEKLAPGDAAVRQKTTELTARETDPAALRKWLEGATSQPKAEGTHPEGCSRAAKKWNDFPFSGRISRQNLETAAAEFEKVLRRDPRHMHAYADAATIREYLGQLSAASTLWFRGLQVDSENALAKFQLLRVGLLEELNSGRPQGKKRVELLNKVGVACLNTGEPDLARRFFREAVNADSGSAVANANLGLACLEIGSYKEAQEALQRALALEPQMAFAESIKTELRKLDPLLKNNRP